MSNEFFDSNQYGAHELTVPISHLRDLEEKLTRLRAELASAKRDAERYTELRELALLGHFALLRHIIAAETREEFDAAIDAARKP